MPRIKLAEIGRFDDEFLSACKGKHALSECDPALRAHQGVVQKRRSRRIVRQALLDELEAAGDRHQEIIEVVRHAARETADRLHLLRLHQLLARPLEGLLCALPLGDIARDLGVADDVAALAVDRDR